MVYKSKIAALTLSAFLLYDLSAHALDLRIMKSPSDHEYISASGTINEGDAGLLRALISGNGVKATIVFNSVGGSVAEALEIGRDLRRNGVDTYVPNDARCLSACVFAFLGGTERTVAKGGSLGSHQFYWPEGAAPSGANATHLTQRLSANVLRHFLVMGADPEALTLIMDTPPEKMLVFTPEMMGRYGLVGASSSSKLPAVIPSGQQRDNCPFPESFVNSDPLNLYPACKR